MDRNVFNTNVEKNATRAMDPSLSLFAAAAVVVVAVAVAAAAAAV